MTRRAVVAAALLLGAGAAWPARACTLVASYRPPTGLELAAQADAIVLAAIVGARPAGNGREGAVLASPVGAIKGARPSGSVELPGATLVEPRAPGPAGGHERVRAADPDGVGGACFRNDFTRGARVVLFLRRDRSGALRPLRYAFARDAEEVGGPDARWVKLVREYAAVSAAPRAAWRERLRTRVARLRARGDTESLAIAAEMEATLPGGRRPG